MARSDTEKAKLAAIMAETPVCANCGLMPSDHRVVGEAGSERLTCKDGQNWSYTKDYQAADLIRRIDESRSLTERLTTKLFKLTQGG